MMVQCPVQCTATGLEMGVKITQAKNFNGKNLSSVGFQTTSSNHSPPIKVGLRIALVKIQLLFKPSVDIPLSSIKLDLAKYFRYM